MSDPSYFQPRCLSFWELNRVTLNYTPGLCGLRSGPHGDCRLHRQDGLGALVRQVYSERVEEEGGLGVMAYQCGQLHQVLRAELVQGPLEKPPG